MEFSHLSIVVFENAIVKSPWGKIPLLHIMVGAFVV